ncbi:MAG: metal-dependent hydrolase, partial [Nanoarchaeota archaeon]
NKFFSSIIGFIFGHRGFFHTVYIPLILFLIFYSISKEIGIGIFIGYSSHLLMDSLTKHGIKPFFPIANKKFYGFIRVNSIFERLLFLAIFTFDAYLILMYIL